MDEDKRITLAGPRVGGPPLDDLIAVTRRLTGRGPTADDIERTRAILAQRGV